jgi:hypothetical protein
MEKPKLNSMFSVLIMFFGMLIGLLILFTKTDHAPEPIGQTIRELIPGKTVFRGNAFKDLILAWKAGQRIEVLMQKDSLTQQDSTDIKAIDHQLNQLLHD